MKDVSMGTNFVEEGKWASPYSDIQKPEEGGDRHVPEVSVIVPVYKAEEYLEECVRSVMAQTFEDFEVILVDDESPDHSGRLCEKLAAGDERIRVFHNIPGGGVLPTRETADLLTLPGNISCFATATITYRRSGLRHFIRWSRVMTERFI